jgi:hypothetical protein
MAKHPASINLLGRKQTTADLILGWALTTGRLIIILTETIALSAFAYRFILDSQIIDLHGEIKQKQAIIDLSKDDEAKYRALQAKLITLTAIDNKSTEVTSTVGKIVGLASGKVVLQTLTVQPNTIQISATTTTISLMNSFINAVKADPSVQGVNISQIENKPESGQITLRLEITLSNKKGAS